VRTSTKKLWDLGFALLSGILAIGVGFLILVMFQIYETASIQACGKSGMVGRARGPIFIAAYAAAGFVYGRRRDYGIDHSLVATSPILVFLVAILRGEQVDITGLIAGTSTMILPPFAAHWLASFLGWQTVKRGRRGETAAAPD
jgi:hypothetical protein